MPEPLVLLSVPALREKDVAVMDHLRTLTAGGEIADLSPGFPSVTCPVQANMTTGKPARDHGVVGNGFYHRDTRRVRMWTSPNDCIQEPQVWDLLSRQGSGSTSAAWFPLHAKGCGADYVCTPAPIHNPDGTESLWCYTRPAELYGTLRDSLGHFPLKHFWGPVAGIASTRWIVDSAILAAEKWRPDFFYVYLPHLDYAAQRSGPDSAAAARAVAELDAQLARLTDGLHEAYPAKPLWLIAGEYAITPVDHVVYPNIILRQAGLLEVRHQHDGEYLDLEKSQAWALVDHQFSHVFVRHRDPLVAARVADLFRRREGIAEVLAGDELARYDLAHDRSGDVVLVSQPNSWQAYYWWVDDTQAPPFTRTVDIHRKPGYDPVELHFDPATKGIPLDATLVKGSHGAPVRDPAQRSVILASRPGLFPHHEKMIDREVFDVVARHFGVQPP